MFSKRKYIKRVDEAGVWRDWYEIEEHRELLGPVKVCISWEAGWSMNPFPLSALN